MESGQFSVILVPQGAEYEAVLRGLRRASFCPIVQAIPAGVQPTGAFLSQLQQSGFFSSRASVLVLGLCGSLTPALAVGDLVLYSQCLRLVGPSVAPSSPLALEPLAIEKLGSRLTPRQVVGLTSDRILWAAIEKTELGQTYGAEVVDMEGAAILEVLAPAKVSVTMLRVVSDGCHHDLPDLTQSVSTQGNLLPNQLALSMVRNPIAATRLIRGSLRGLFVLQKVVSELFHRE